MKTSVSVLGLGMMGRPMARRLIGSGYNVRGWNRSALPLDLTAGIRLCQKLEAAACADVCLLMLRDSAAVDQVLEKLTPYLSAGQIVLDMGSSDPAHSREIAPRLASEGIGWVDAPVSGGPEGASQGTLAIMAGGRPDDFTRVKPILDVLGANVVHVGGPGRGHTVKVINQLIVGLTIETVAEALTLAEKSGIDPRLVQLALQGGFADSKILQLHGTRMIDRNYVPGAKASIQLKDLRLAKELAAQTQADLPHLKSTIALYEMLMSRGDGDLDHSAIHKLRWF
jgi:3-hydroxyisobutyrate dehydrogenase-like beta-hydroxyacid dehydrogenase